MSESRLKAAVRNETMRAEAAEAARDDANKTARELQASMAAATARANEAAKSLTAVQDELTNTKINLDLVVRKYYFERLFLILFYPLISHS